MIRTVVIPASNNINLHIPNNYIGKEIEVFFYAKEELVEDTKAPTNNMAKFKGILSNEEATKYDSHLKQARNEWNRDFLIDSNVLIDYASSRLPQKGSDFVEAIFNANFLISVAVKIEVLGFDDLPDKLTAMEEFVNAATVLPLDDAVTQQTILLRRQYKKLKLGDAIIAATALVHKLILITRNMNDFKAIKGLIVVDAHSL